MMNTLSGIRRSFSGLEIAVTVGAVLLWLWLLRWTYVIQLPRVQLTLGFVGGLLVVYALMAARSAHTRDDRLGVATMTGSAVAIAVATVVFYRGFHRVYLEQSMTTVDHALGLAVVLAVLALAWYEFGPVVPAILVGAIGYALVGDVLPGGLGHDGFGVTDVLEFLAAPGTGFTGTIVQNVVTWLAGFVLFAALLVSFGGLRLVRYLGARASSRIESGAAGTLAVASAILASVTGSYLANATLVEGEAVSTLSDDGVDERTAAGIDAAASTAGQVLPPVMALAAVPVVIASPELTASQFVLAGVVPATILFACFLLGIRYEIARDTAGDTSQLSTDERTRTETDWTPSRTALLAEIVRFAAPIVLLVSMLRVAEWPILTTMFWSIGALVVFGIGVPVGQSIYAAIVGRSGAAPVSDGGSPSIVQSRPVTALGRALGDAISGCRLAVSAFAPVVVVTVAIAGAFDLLLVQGSLSGAVAVLGELETVGPVVVVALALVVAAIVTAGLPTIAAVAIVSYPLGTTLTTAFGFDAVTTHYAMLYAAVVVGSLPRTMTAAGETATEITTDASRRAVAGVAVRLLAPMFVFPFAFVSHPELASPSPSLEATRAWLFVLVGGLTLTYSVTAPLESRPAFGRRRWARAGLGALGVLTMAAPFVPLQAVAAVCAVAVVGFVARR